ncbi:23S rRNA (guanosine(2251)-2'-O)-methyltransferase RlmB [Mycoplasma procyoni]|uniref:23S rRNA (guanosine(2251)-2'-O)-methyltransferase RlmB n=1 Tax=Mycoplasma procyoni TaxID=568784 RepID=UPI00197C063B|nr:23S rRNA (guanosine(2251)-2'-O)-methyltransferase RlmB [Mycoplasma procyoni]MBN3534468.1 23S rRNA (guanosine(2251)-2'-O)-methyltransferase RlmB [Mycoplasma procyoni]
MKKLICGKNSVQEAIENNFPIIKIYTNRPNEIANFEKSKIQLCDLLTLNKMTKENHQGFIAEIKNIDFFDLNTIFKDRPEKILILDHIQDPHNFGAIIRTANAAGVNHIIIPKDRAVDITPTVLKVSSGGFINMKFIKVSSISAAITKMKKEGIWIYGTTLNDNSQSIHEATFNYPLAIVMGSESKGISKSVENLCDVNIYIPMKGSVQSLNVSVATGIVLFKI